MNEKTKDEGKDPTDEINEGEITGACDCCGNACYINYNGSDRRPDGKDKGV